jgi:hypothetical protein
VKHKSKLGEPSPHAFVVMTLGYWGRGKTIAEAANNCAKEGGRAGDVAVVKLVVGHDRPEVTTDGYLAYAQNSELFHVGSGVKLGVLKKMK